MWYMGSAENIFRVKGGPWNPFFLFYYIYTTNFISLYFLYTPTTFHMTPHISTFSYIFGKCYHFLFYIDPIKIDNDIEYYIDSIKMDNDRKYYVDPINMDNDREYYINTISYNMNDDVNILKSILCKK